MSQRKNRGTDNKIVSDQNITQKCEKQTAQHRYAKSAIGTFGENRISAVDKTEQDKQAAANTLECKSKAIALINGRNYVVPDDVKALIYSVLRHRITLNYAAVADNVTEENIIHAIVGAIRTP